MCVYIYIYIIKYTDTILNKVKYNIYVCVYIYIYTVYNII